MAAPLNTCFRGDFGSRLIDSRGVDYLGMCLAFAAFPSILSPAQKHYDSYPLLREDTHVEKQRLPL